MSLLNKEPQMTSLNLYLTLYFLLEHNKFCVIMQSAFKKRLLQATLVVFKVHVRIYNPVGVTEKCF